MSLHESSLLEDRIRWQERRNRGSNSGANITISIGSRSANLSLKGNLDTKKILTKANHKVPVTADT